MIALFAILLLFAVPSWGFDAATTRVPMNTITGLQSVTFVDFSVDCTADPCAAIFILTAGVTDNTAADDALMSLGFTDGTTQKVVLVHDNDAGSTTDSIREMRGDRVIETMDASGITGEAHFYDWQSNGLRINIEDAPPAAYLLTVMIMGGAGFQSKVGTIAGNASVDGTADITEPGFTPDAVLISSTRLATNSSSTYLFTAGMAVNDGSSTQGSIGCFSDHGVTTTNVHAVTSSLYAAQLTDGGGLDMALQIGSWDASGFTATTKVVGVAANFSYLALKFGGPASAVFDIDTRTTVGATSHTLGFRPLAGMVFGTLARAYDTDEADSDATQCMISAYAGNGQYAHTNTMEDGLSTGPNTTSRVDDSGVMMLSPSGTCTLNSCSRAFIILDPTAVTLDYFAVYTDAVRKWIGFAVEDEVGVLARRRGPGLLQ